MWRIECPILRFWNVALKPNVALNPNEPNEAMENEALKPNEPNEAMENEALKPNEALKEGGCFRPNHLEKAQHGVHIYPFDSQS